MEKGKLRDERRGAEKPFCLRLKDGETPAAPETSFILRERASALLIKSLISFTESIHQVVRPDALFNRHDLTAGGGRWAFH